MVQIEVFWWYRRSKRVVGRGDRVQDEMQCQWEQPGVSKVSMRPRLVILWGCGEDTGVGSVCQSRILKAGWRSQIQRPRCRDQYVYYIGAPASPEVFSIRQNFRACTWVMRRSSTEVLRLLVFQFWIDQTLQNWLSDRGQPRTDTFPLLKENHCIPINTRDQWEPTQNTCNMKTFRRC